MKAEKRSDLMLLAWLFRQARPYWLKLTAIFGLRLLATPLALLVPVPLMLAVDNVIGDRPPPSFLLLLLPESIADSRALILAVAVGLILLIALLTQLRNIISALLETYVSEKLVLKFRARLLNQAQRLSATYHDRKGTADTVYRIQYDAPASQSILIHGLVPFVTAAFTLVSMLVIIANIDGLIAMVALTVSPVLVLITGVFRKRLRSHWKKVKRAESSTQSVVHEVLGALRIVQAYGREEDEEARFVERARGTIKERMQAVFSESLYSVYVACVMAVGTSAVLYLGVTHVQQNILSVGQLLLVMSYLVQLYEPLKEIGRQITKLQSGLASADRACAFLNEQPSVSEKPDALPVKSSAGEIRFEHVSFAYAEDRMILKDISYVVDAGMRIGIAGHTGAGKSTLVNLLMRFYDPAEGRILLDGHDLRDYRVADLRDQFGLVLQDTVLFSASIAENIAYGKPDATMEEIIRAAEVANADDFISRLPDGYDTPVGERGMLLSGGERQRISLARAFLKNAPILILDEPTSSVDIKTEAVIMEAMERLMQGRTTFMIAHRLSTLENCDRVLLIDNGRLMNMDSADVGSALKNAVSGNTGILNKKDPACA